MQSNAGDITVLIALWQNGDKQAENELFSTLYQKLRAIAFHCLKSETRPSPVGATTLVHEAYLRLHRTETLMVNNRGHFLSLVSQVMRRIVIDLARTQKSAQRGGGAIAVSLDEALVASDGEADRILAIDIALRALAKRSPRQAKVVELRYFGGFDEAEAAAILNVATRTVRRDWQIARTRLRIAIDGENSGESGGAKAEGAASLDSKAL